MEVGEVGGEAGAEHGVAPLAVQDLVQLGLREPNLSQKHIKVNIWTPIDLRLFIKIYPGH